jgi:hypothetical protein
MTSQIIPTTSYCLGQNNLKVEHVEKKSDFISTRYSHLNYYDGFETDADP